MQAIPAEDIVEDRINKCVAKPQEKFVRCLIARHFFQFLQKTPLPYFNREAKTCTKLAEYLRPCILIKLDILKVPYAPFHTPSFFTGSSLAKGAHRVKVMTNEN